jgi:hypothetical protein
LRSRTVEGAYQEKRGALIACNLIRREIASAAWEARLEPIDYQLLARLAHDPARNDAGCPQAGIREITRLSTASA